jgi:glycosyltransferase involved in cell wall biosynthesis
MKLLIVTQVIDTEHPILGFFHRWVEEFAKHCEQVHVICLQAGTHSLPANVTIHSLGKEEGRGRLTYLWRFYNLIFTLRNEYDSVFVHMNQLYVILGAPFWRAAGKPIGLWYAHGTVARSLKIAEKLVDRIFTCSADSFRLPSAKVLVTGHGIDTERFTVQEVQKDIDLITVGRITESKNLIVLIDVLKEVRKIHPVTLTIVGSALAGGERAYEAKLRAHIAELGLADAVIFLGKVPQTDLPTVLNRAKVFVTTAQNGSLDKAMLEAMACGLPIVSMAPGSASLPLGSTQTTNPGDFTTALQSVLESGEFCREDYQIFVQKDHSTQSLIPKIIRTFS